MNQTRARWAGLLLALLLLLTLCHAAAESAGEVAPHNYILLIDNSGSTTGRHSLGGATDPQGLRFDAAKLVYQNVAISATNGAKGKLAVIVFCGSENCVAYGPLDIDDPSLDAEIGDKLNEKANVKFRDDYTDIRAALEKARDMLAGFDGETSVLLLTDGVNDLTNKSDPFSRPENIEANEASVGLVSEMRAAGADVHIVALTSEADVDKTADFMAFIDQLAEAGGGEIAEDGNYGNVLMATQADLNSKLLQSLIRSETAADAAQTIVAHTPVDAAFTVPYDGITDATVNITFLPEDKEKLEKVELVTPDGERRVPWDADGAHESDGIGVTEDRSYILLEIPEPEAGEWRAVVTSRDGDTDSPVLINAVVRFNHSLRLNVRMEDAVEVGEELRIDAWFQEYDGERFVDMTENDIYAQSEASLTVTTPSGRQRTIGMKREGSQFTAAFRAKTPGEWKVQLKVKNRYVQETSDELAFRVMAQATPESTDEAEPALGPMIEEMPTPEPTQMPEPAQAVEFTSTPEPTPTPIPEIVPIEALTLDIEPSATTETGEVYLTADYARFSWRFKGRADAVEATVENGDKRMSVIASGMSLPRSIFEEGKVYTFRVSAMPHNGAQVGAEPAVAELVFRLVPVAIESDAIALEVAPIAPSEDETLYVDRNAEAITVSWRIDGTAESVEAELLKDGETLLTGLQSGDAIERDLLEDGAQYTLRVSALPIDGAAAGLEPTVSTLDFQLYPEAQPIEGLTLDVSTGAKDGVARLKDRQAKLIWMRTGGLVDHYVLTVIDSKGNTALAEVLDGTAATYDLTLPGDGDYVATLAATARYAPEDAAPTVATLSLHSPSFMEKYWYFIAAGAVALVGGAAALIVVQKKKKGGSKKQ